MKTRRAAFTLLELLVVIAIVSVLSALLYTALGSSSKKGKAATSMNNLKQWGVAFKSSLADHDGRMPFDGQTGAGLDLADTNAWYIRLPPYIQEKPLNHPDWIIKPARPGDKSVWINPVVPEDEGNKYISPPAKFLFCYGMNYSLASKEDKTQPFSRIENQGGTVLMAEKSDEFPNLNPEHVRAYFGSGDPKLDKESSAHFLFCDGHVELKKRVDFDANYMKIDPDNPSPIDNTKLNLHFTFVPYVGAVPE